MVFPLAPQRDNVFMGCARHTSVLVCLFCLSMHLVVYYLCVVQAHLLLVLKVLDTCWAMCYHRLWEWGNEYVSCVAVVVGVP
jgi:hypothetical protein